jgi:hypothetical protein
MAEINELHYLYEGPERFNEREYVLPIYFFNHVEHIATLRILVSLDEINNWNVDLTNFQEDQSMTELLIGSLIKVEPWIENEVNLIRFYSDQIEKIVNMTTFEIQMEDYDDTNGVKSSSFRIQGIRAQFLMEDHNNDVTLFIDGLDDGYNGMLKINSVISQTEQIISYIRNQSIHRLYYLL